MPRKFSQEEAKQKSLDVGIELVGKYLGSNIHSDFKCPFCSKIFRASPNNIWQKNIVSCSCKKRADGIRSSNFINKRFGKLIVLEFAYIREKCKKSVWKCICDCGNICYVSRNNLVSDNTISCGCYTAAYSQKQAEEKSLNVGIKMMGKYINSKIKTEFECPYCGKIFLASPNNVWQKHYLSCGCLTLTYSQKQAEEKSLNVGIKMIGKYISSKINTEFECPYCNKTFLASPNNIWQKVTMGCGCKRSVGENYISKFLNDYKIDFKQEKTFNICRNPKTNSLLRFDFYLPQYNICIEYQGEQHYKPIERFGGKEKFKKQHHYDQIKRDFCKKEGIKLLEISYWEFKNVEEILKKELGLVDG